MAVTAILVGGIRPEHLAPNTKPPLIGTSNHGRHLAQIRMTGRGSQTKLEVTQIAIPLFTIQVSSPSPWVPTTA